MLERYWFTNS